MSIKPIWVARCVCPRGHTLCSVTYTVDAGSPPEVHAPFIRCVQDFIADMLSLQTIKGWCALCGAPATDWQFLRTRSRYTNPDDEITAQQLAAEAECRQRDLQRLIGLTYEDSPNQQCRHVRNNPVTG